MSRPHLDLIKHAPTNYSCSECPQSCTLHSVRHTNLRAGIEQLTVCSRYTPRKHAATRRCHRPRNARKCVSRMPSARCSYYNQLNVHSCSATLLPRYHVHRQHARIACPNQSNAPAPCLHRWHQCFLVDVCERLPLGVSGRPCTSWSELKTSLRGRHTPSPPPPRLIVLIHS